MCKPSRLVLSIRTLLVLVLCQPLALAAVPAPAKGYITDKIEVQMRAGQGTRHKVLKVLSSGTPLTVLDRNGATGYSLVKLDSGEQGWVQTQYLTAEATAGSPLDAVREENRRLKDELAALMSGKEGAEKTPLQAEIGRLNTELIAVRQASANVLQIQEERDRLQERVINLERDLETIRREKGALDAESRQNWFLIGGGVLFGGILLGVLLPRLSWRKKSHWDSF